MSAPHSTTLDIPCARGCNGIMSELGHTAYCWRNQTIALRAELARLTAASEPKLTGPDPIGVDEVAR